MDYLNHDNQADVIKAFNSTPRYLDDVVNIDNLSINRKRGDSKLSNLYKFIKYL